MAWVKRPAPLPSRIVTSFEPESTTARSGFPSRLKSLDTIAQGWLPAATGEPGAAANPPAPSPSRTVTSSEFEFATARSPVPSRLKSPAAIERGPVPTVTGEPGAGARPPAPLPSRIVTLFEAVFATARSAVPSLSKSAMATARGVGPTVTGEPAALAKPPEPLPSRTVTVPAARLDTTRSALPSWLKSPVAIEAGVPPTLTGDPGAALKPPAPLPSRTVTSFEIAFATARSALLSALKSAVATAAGEVPGRDWESSPPR